MSENPRKTPDRQLWSNAPGQKLNIKSLSGPKALYLGTANPQQYFDIFILFLIPGLRRSTNPAAGLKTAPLCWARVNMKLSLCPAIKLSTGRGL